MLSETIRIRLLSAWLACLLLLTLAGSATAQPPRRGGDEVDEHAVKIRSTYTKFEYRIPMRDGVKLFTAVYVPNDTSKSYPFLMVRTPYSVGPYGADRYPNRLGPSEEFVDDGYIFVYQDVRGRYLSEGEFVDMRPHVAGKTKGSKTQVDESTDTWDTIEWLLQNVRPNNGKVGQWGISYPGFYAAAGMIDSHPALEAVSPQAPIADWFWDDMHRHGAFVLPLAFNFFSSFGVARPEPTTERAERFDHETPDGYQFFLDLGPLKNVNEKYFKGEIAFWNDIVAHPNYDEFWQSRNILPHLKNVKSAVLVVGGWFDTEDLYGPLKIYRETEKNNRGIFNTLVMGPWPHGGWNRVEGDRLGTADFGFKTSDYFQQHVQRPFFRHFLKGEGQLDLPEALIFETGADRWRRFDAWPPKDLRAASLYLADGGSLAWEPPAAQEPAADRFVSDPAKPVPYTQEITAGWARDYMTEDQRFAAWRPDVLVYQTEVLEEDLTLAGPVEAELFVSTTGTDADWIVKVIDVFPGRLPDWVPESGETDWGGKQELVRAEVFRGRFRESYVEPKPFVAGEVTRVAFELQDFFHTFKRGHRLMVQIQSTWFPFIDRNPQTFVPNIFEADEADFVPATHSVYRSGEHSSRLRVGVMP